MAYAWKDATSYRQNERGKIDARISELKAGHYRIIVHRYLGLDGFWFVSCPDLCVNDYQLKSTLISDAKREAVQVLFERAVSIQCELARVIAEDPQ